MICISQIYDNGSIWRRVCRAFSPDKSDRSGFIFGGIRPSSSVSIFPLWPSKLLRQCYETDRTEEDKASPHRGRQPPSAAKLLPRLLGFISSPCSTVPSAPSLSFSS